MKILLGAFLAGIGFLLVPNVQKFVSETFNVRRQRLSYIGVLSVVLLVFAAVPMFAWQWTLGAMCIALSAAMLWIVPRSQKVKWWMQEIFFGEHDILDKNAPYVKVVNLFKLPLMGLGFWIIAPWTVIILDIIAIVGAFLWWGKNSLTAAKKEAAKKNEEEKSAATGVAMDASTT